MKELIVLVGPAGSGKTTYATSLPHVRISQDDSGKDGHIKQFQACLEAGQSMTIDRMGFNKNQRERYLVPAKAKGYTTKIIVLHQSREVCFSRMKTRQDHPTIKNETDANNALNTFFSKYERPKADEADSVEFIYPTGVKDKCVVVDLDGTLCNLDHRLYHVRGDKKDWKSFFNGLEHDTPNMWCKAIVDSMSNHYTIVFASGRPDSHRATTKAWLEKYDFSTNQLYMRNRADHRQDYVAKEIILDFEILTRFEPMFFIDDRKQVTDMWRKRGFVCLQCHEGDF